MDTGHVKLMRVQTSCILSFVDGEVAMAKSVRFLVRQRGRADGGWRSHGRPVWSSPYSGGIYAARVGKASRGRKPALKWMEDNPEVLKP